MIDTEPKVLKPFIDKPLKYLDPGNVKFFEHGRGNNWSYGYLHSLPNRNTTEKVIENHKEFSNPECKKSLVEAYI